MKKVLCFFNDFFIGLKRNLIFNLFLLVLIGISLFGGTKVKAYYSFNRNQSISFTTAAYTALSLTTDRNTYGMCNRDATVKLTINNPNIYNVNYTISINDSKLTYTVDGLSGSSYTVTKNGTNTHTIVLKGTTTNTSVSIIVTPTGAYSSNHSKNINLDLVCPVCTWETPTTNSIKNGDTFIYNLSCTDANGIATSTLTSNSFIISNPNALSIENITSTSITNGYKYTITTKGGSANDDVYIRLNAGVVFDKNNNSNVLSKSPNIKIDNSVVVNFNASGGSISTTTKTVNYKMTYGELPTPTKSGYKFLGWYTAVAGGSLVDSATIVSNPNTHTLYAQWLDIEAPTCIFGTFDKETITTSETANIKLTCTDNVGVITNTLTSSSFTFSNSDAISISNITSSSITNGIVYTITIAGGSTNASSTITLKDGSIKDAAGNSNAAVTSPSITNIVDQSGPEITFSPNGNMTYSKSQATKVTITDMSGVVSAKYLWTQTNGANASNGTLFTSDSTITKNTGDGLWYLCVYATDTYGNVTNECSDAFALDNTPPVITANDICILKGQTLVISNYASASDAHGVRSLTAPSFSTGNVTTGTITITATDNAGNTSTKTVTVRVFTKLIDRDLVTTGNGLYADSQTAGRYYYKGLDPHNYLSFNGTLWRILSLEPDGSVKIILKNAYISAPFHSANSGLTNFTSVAAYASLVDYYNNTLTAESKKYLTSHVSYSGVVSYGASTANTIADTVNAEKGATITTNIVLPSITDYLRASNNCNDSTSWKSINNSPFVCKTYNWMYDSGGSYWFLNAYSATRARYQNTSGAVSLYTVSDLRGYRPVVYLKATTTFQGNGTTSSPYTVCTACSSSGVSSTTCTVTTPSGYDTSKTITITPSSTTGITYSWDGVTWTSSPSKTVTAAGTYNGWIKDSTGKTNGCSITINSRTEYRKASCTAKYGSWNKSATDYIDESEECGQTKTQAENNGSLYYYNCFDIVGGSSVCIQLSGYPLCKGRDKYTRSCNSINCGEFGEWQTNSIGRSCGRKVETRTTIGK